MSNPIKPILAIAVLGGVALVWLPKFTDFDPLGLNASAGTPDASGTPELTPGFDLPTPSESIDAALAAGAGGGESAASGSENGNALSALGAVLSYLEERDTVRDLDTSTAVAARAVAQEARERLAIDEPRFPLAAPTSVSEFLETNPLSAVAIGATRSGALFGRINVEPGDALLGGAIVVHAIERDGVVLDTDAGRLRVPLPAPGELAPRVADTPASDDRSSGAGAAAPTSAGADSGAPVRAGDAPSPSTSSTGGDAASQN